MDYADTSEMAARLGLRFDSAQNYVLADDYAFLRPLTRGENRYAFNVLSGKYQQSDVLAFDFHYEKPRKGSDNELTNPHYYLTVIMVLVPAYFPELQIVPEG